MTPNLQNLDSQEAMLLMYLADELSPADRIEMDRRLASDADLRARLNSLRQIHHQLIAGLETLDIVAKQSRDDEIITHRVVQAMTRYQLELASRPAVTAPTWHRRSWPWWSYPLASAAAIVFVVIGLWGVGIIDWSPDLAISNQQPQQKVDSALADAAANDAIFEALKHSLVSNTSPSSLDEADAQLRSLEGEEVDQVTPTL